MKHEGGNSLLNSDGDSELRRLQAENKVLKNNIECRCIDSWSCLVVMFDWRCSVYCSLLCGDTMMIVKIASFNMAFYNNLFSLDGFKQVKIRQYLLVISRSTWAASFKGKHRHCFFMGGRVKINCLIFSIVTNDWVLEAHQPNTIQISFYTNLNMKLLLFWCTSKESILALINDMYCFPTQVIPKLAEHVGVWYDKVVTRTKIW